MTGWSCPRFIVLSYLISVPAMPARIKYALRNAATLRPFCSGLSDRLFFIFGCQRSGTTLLLSVLNAHPQIACVDETEFPSTYPFPSAQRLALSKLAQKYLCFKMLEHSNKLNFLAEFYPQAKVLWPVRNPHSTISSMLNLTNSKGDWIDRCVERELDRLKPFFPSELENRDLAKCSKIEKAALYWRCKNQYPAQLEARGFKVLPFKYEDLLKNQKTTLESIMEFLGLAWSEDLLNFHQKNPGKALAGGTRTDRPINKTRAANLKSKLNSRDIATINSICAPVMAAYDYPDL